MNLLNVQYFLKQTIKAIILQQYHGQTIAFEMEFYFMQILKCEVYTIYILNFFP